MPYGLGHGWDDARTAINGGLMNQFDLVIHGNENGVYLGYTQFSQGAIPNYWTYAQKFTLADNMFSSLTGPSFPNHLYTVAATSGGAINNPNGVPNSSWGCDADPGELVDVMDQNGNITRQPPCFRLPDKQLSPTFVELTLLLPTAELMFPRSPRMA